MPEHPQYAYLTRHALNDGVSLTVYQNGSRLLDVRAPGGLPDLEAVTKWASTTLFDNGYIRREAWAQPDGFDEYLHDYKAQVIALPEGWPPSRPEERYLEATQDRPNLAHLRNDSFSPTRPLASR